MGDENEGGRCVYKGRIRARPGREGGRALIGPGAPWAPGMTDVEGADNGSPDTTTAGTVGYGDGRTISGKP
jgi:hypothetical protein